MWSVKSARSHTINEHFKNQLSYDKRKKERKKKKKPRLINNIRHGRCIQPGKVGGIKPSLIFFWNHPLSIIHLCNPTILRVAQWSVQSTVSKPPEVNLGWSLCGGFLPQSKEMPKLNRHYSPKIIQKNAISSMMAFWVSCRGDFPDFLVELGSENMKT